jgi:nondiscriminating glutamyl-tRNA synthetase
MDRVAKNPAVFDSDKLNWLNSHYIRQTSPEAVLELALPHLKAAGYVGANLSGEEQAWLVQVVATVQEYVSYAAQVVDHAAIFFNDDVQLENAEAEEVLRDADIPQVMAAFREKLSALETVDEAAVKGVLKSITKELKLGGNKVYMPIRIALTGQAHGPDLLKLIVLLGRDRVLDRLEKTLKSL